MLVNAARPQKLGALLTKTQEQAGSVCAWKQKCVRTCVGQCWFRTTTQHRRTSVSASVVGADLASDQAWFHLTFSASGVLSVSNQTPLPCPR